MRISLFLILLLSVLFSNEQNRNILKIKQLIAQEESIAKAYEEYLLKEHKYPSSLQNLLDKEYLEELIKTNYFDIDLEFNLIKVNDSEELLITPLELKYHIKDEVETISNITIVRKSYIYDFYNLNRYREYTKVKNKKIEIVLQSKKAQNISSLLENGFSIDCRNDSFCIENDKHIKYKDPSGNWLMFDLEGFFLSEVAFDLEGAVTVSKDARILASVDLEDTIIDKFKIRTGFSFPYGTIFYKENDKAYLYSDKIRVIK